MKELVMLVGPPGSGKSTYSQKFKDHIRISQDDMGKETHKLLFQQALEDGVDIVLDRMNFNKEQRNRYLIPAKEVGYTTNIVVLHESYDTCFSRCMERKDHPTIKDEKNARAALHTFFTKYERVQDDEAHTVIRLWPDNYKPEALICDLDGTLCNIDHRLHFVKTEGKKNWDGFFNGIKDDNLNQWCNEIIIGVRDEYRIVLCSGRGKEYENTTRDWLNRFGIHFDNLFMRPKGDFRRDDIIKEILLDFEILTRYRPIFAIDDRQQVVDKWRSRGITTLQCAKGDF